MGKLFWSNQIPGQSLEGGIEFLNQLSWNLTVRQKLKNWQLYAGDQILFEAFSEDELEAFIHGMAITLAVLPEYIIAEIKKVASE